MFHLPAAFAQLERKLIRERVRAGLANARAKGKRLGRPRRVRDSEALRMMRARGMSLRAIAAAAGCSRSTVHEALLELASSVRVAKRVDFHATSGMVKAVIGHKEKVLKDATR